MKFSIVTVCYNAEKRLKKTIESVLRQTYQDFEYIVIDGGSTDGSLSVLESYGIRYVSESDDGIYDAMNKAIALCKGIYVLFLNAGDLLVSKDTLSRVAECINSDIAYGDCVLAYEERYKYHKANDIDTILQRQPFCHQSVFTKKELFDVRKFDTRYKSLADYEFFLYFYLKKQDFQYMHFPIAVYENGGYSCMKRKISDKELVMIKKRYSLDYHQSVKGTIRTFLSEITPNYLYKWYLRFQRVGYKDCIEDAIVDYIASTKTLIQAL